MKLKKLIYKLIKLIKLKKNLVVCLPIHHFRSAIAGAAAGWAARKIKKHGRSAIDYLHRAIEMHGRAPSRGRGHLAGLSRRHGRETRRVDRRGIEPADATAQKLGRERLTVKEREQAKFMSMKDRIDFRKSESNMDAIKRILDKQRSLFDVFDRTLDITINKKQMLKDIMRATDFFGRGGEFASFSEKHKNTFTRIAEKLEEELKRESNPIVRKLILDTLEKMAGSGIDRARDALLNIHEGYRRGELSLRENEIKMISRIVSQIQQQQMQQMQAVA